ncbi:hypothetical protein DPMN_141843 [Dreissena polymorpha]|uniref:Uncharacterized protein n=1 Tax=Dreissena polymorpha TaxID=45954 RepID=A0A9D4GAR7_DREPO|nr:hypothetical protein DPMN_141843 [Dreissena polymorpha]
MPQLKLARAAVRSHVLVNAQQQEHPHSVGLAVPAWVKRARSHPPGSYDAARSCQVLADGREGGRRHSARGSRAGWTRFSLA